MFNVAILEPRAACVFDDRPPTEVSSFNTAQGLNELLILRAG